jgi:hypothetical protein
MFKKSFNFDCTKYNTRKCLFPIRKIYNDLNTKQLSFCTFQHKQNKQCITNVMKIFILCVDCFAKTDINVMAFGYFKMKAVKRVFTEINTQLHNFKVQQMQLKLN